MIDIGLNLSHSQFDPDRDSVVSRAREAGVQGMLLTGTSWEQSEQVLTLAQRYPSFCRSTAGVHPHLASSWTPTIAQSIERLATHALVLAVGECGLDYNRMASTRPMQLLAFEAQLELALRVNKPVFLHLREGTIHRQAENDFFSRLDPFVARGGRGILHCFTSGPRLLDQALRRGLWIGVAGWVCDERRGQELREAVPLIPDDRLLIETDAPYLTPRSMPNGKKIRHNEPAFLIHVAQELAQLRSQSLAIFQQQTTLNSQSLFGWGPQPSASSTPCRSQLSF